MSELEQHHRYSASGSEGWMTCAGKIAMEEGIPDKYSPYADEGSAAHFLASECLLNKVDVDTYLDRTIVCYNQEGKAYQAFANTEIGLVLPEGAVYSSEWVVDVEMVAYVQRYVDRIWQDSKDGTLFVEQRVEFGEYIGDPGAFGTADAIILSNDGKTVKIRDLKYGFKPVSAVDNKQMMLYALGVLYSFDYLIDPNLVEEIDMGIIQPRTNSPDEPWIITPTELFEFADEAKAAIAQAEEARSVLNDHDKMSDFGAGAEWEGLYLTPSEKGCQWCKAKGKCPALAMESVNTMLVAPATADGLDDLDASTDMEAVMDTALQHIPELDFDTVVNLYKVKDKIQIWIDAINDRMMHDMLLGFKTPHFKLVKGREGNRKWKSDTEVEAAMKSMKLKVDEIYAKKVVSPAYAEKVIAKKYPKKWEKLQEHVTRSEAKLAVAPINDKRESFDPHGEKLALLPDLTDLTVDDLL